MTQTTATIEAIRAAKQLLMALIVVGGASFVGYTYVKQPNAPTPAPTPQTDLAALVDADARPFLAAFYRDLAAVTKHPHLKSTGQFEVAYRIAIPIAQETSNLPSVAPIDQPISLRIKAAVGPGDEALTDEKREALVQCLEGISKEFQ